MNNMLPTLPKDIFELVLRPRDTSYRSGWVYQTVTLRLVKTGELYTYEGISHTKTWSSTHKRRNELLIWAEKAAIGDTCCLSYSSPAKGIMDIVSFATDKQLPANESQNNVYKALRKAVRKYINKHLEAELDIDDSSDGKLHKHVRKCVNAVASTAKKAIELNTGASDMVYYNKVSKMLFRINPQTDEFELHYIRDFDGDNMYRFHKEHPGLYNSHDNSDYISEWLKGQRYMHFNRRIFSLHINEDGYDEIAESGDCVPLISDYTLLFQ